jgi:hypothetical protein
MPLLRYRSWIRDSGRNTRFNKKEEKEKDLWITPKLWWWHHWYRWKDLDKPNPTIPKKVTNGDHNGPHEWAKGKGALTVMTWFSDPWPTYRKRSPFKFFTYTNLNIQTYLFLLTQSKLYAALDIIIIP